MTLEDERDFLLRSIEDLDAEHAAGEIADADYRALRDDYTANAAAVLRQLDARAPGEGGFGRADTGMPVSARPKRVLAALVVVALAVGGGLAVAAASGERVADAPATGSLPEASTDRITRAQALVRDGEILEAIKVYDSLIADDPTNPVALAERGWLVSRVDATLVDRGLASIEAAIAADPSYAEAHFFKGMILLNSKNDPAGAAAAFQHALDAGPPPDIVGLIEDARDRAEASVRSTP